MSSTQNTITDATGTVWSFATTPKGKAGHLVSLGKADAPTHVSYPACGQISSARTGGVYAQPWVAPTTEVVTCRRCARLLQQITAEIAPKEGTVSSTQTSVYTQPLIDALADGEAQPINPLIRDIARQHPAAQPNARAVRALIALIEAGKVENLGNGFVRIAVAEIADESNEPAKEGTMSSTETTKPKRYNWARMTQGEKRDATMRAHRLQTPALQALINAQTRGSAAHKALLAVKAERQAYTPDSAPAGYLASAEPQAVSGTRQGPSDEDVEKAVRQLEAEMNTPAFQEAVAAILNDGDEGPANELLAAVSAEAPQAAEAVAPDPKRILAESAGARYSVRNRRTRSVITIYDSEKAGLDTDGAKYTVVCETHGESIGENNLRTASHLRDNPHKFCSECAAVLRRKAYK